MQASLCKTILAALILLGAANSFADFYPITGFIGTNFVNQTTAASARNGIGATGFQDVTNIVQSVATGSTNFPYSAITNAPWLLTNYWTSGSNDLQIQINANTSSLQYKTTTNQVQGILIASNYLQSIPVSATNQFATTNLAVSSIQKDGIVSAYQSNILTYPVSIGTNPLTFYSGTIYPAINATNFYFNNAFGAYTNRQGSTSYYLFYSTTYGGWVIQSNSITYTGTGANYLFGDSGYGSPDIAAILDFSPPWTRFDSSTDDNLVLTGTITNLSTNSFLVATSPIKSTLTTNNYNFQIASDSNGRDLYYAQFASNALVSFAAPRWIVVSNAAYAVANGSAGGAGLQNYIFNCQSPQNGINPTEPRFAVGASTLFGTNGTLGGLIEFLQQRDRRFNDSIQQDGTHFWHPIKLNPDGSIALGNNPTAEHTLYYAFTNGWIIHRVGTLSRASDYFEPSPRPTNLFNGNLWFETNSATSTGKFMTRQTGATFPIPQINQTNAVLTAATTFTWAFTYPFADTNYSVSCDGMGAPIVSPQIGAKTTTNVVITFTAFTGTLNAIAVRQ